MSGLAPFVNLYGCEVGDETRIGAFVEVQKQATIGKRCKISSHTFICSGVVIEDGVFIGHGVVFINDRCRARINGDGSVQSESDGAGRNPHPHRRLDWQRRHHHVRSDCR